MARKSIRKNYLKNSTARRHAKIMQRIKTGLKIAAALVVLVLTSFVFILGYDLLTQCDYFSAQNLTVAGNRSLSAAYVLQQAHIQKGMNILSINLQTSRKKLLAHPWIAEAEVSRELPSGIAIHIKEHQPLAVIDLGRKFLINTQGEIFKEASANDPANLPLVRGLEISDVNVKGQAPSLSFNAVMNVLHLGKRPDSILPIQLIKRIEVDRQIGLTIYAPGFESGRVEAIKIGYHDYPDKLAGLKSVMNYINKRQEFSRLDSIDLNDIDRIVVHPAGLETSLKDQKEA